MDAVQLEHVRRLLAAAVKRRLLRTVAERTGISYSYLLKLSCGAKPLERVGDVYLRALVDGLESVLERQDGDAA
ncbi:MAG: hypothetical protein DIU70_006470 [Bacillota bacterium]|nr:MAG: hypothetical protein DIU70_01565 [Bacillota bacterium]